MQNRKKKDTDLYNSLLDSVGEGEGGMFQENSIETCILSTVKQMTSPGWVHETSARAWCTVIWYFYIFVLYIHSFNKASYILVTIVDGGDTVWTKWRCTLGKS